jgi:hypothetical protein
MGDGFKSPIQADSSSWPYGELNPTFHVNLFRTNQPPKCRPFGDLGMLKLNL